MREETWLNDYVFTVDEFLTPDECKKYIDIGEDVGFEEALVNSEKGSVRVPDLRNNDRVMFKNHEIADWLWDRGEEFIPAEWEGRTAIGLNELLRFYRYDAAQKFNWHQDFPYERDNGESSCLTLLIYLNSDFEGGETSFDDSCSDESFDEFQIVPKQGLAVFFEHQTYHQGEPVLAGRKYVLRTDVMYSAVESSDELDDFDSYEDDEIDNW